MGGAVENSPPPSTNGDEVQEAEEIFHIGDSDNLVTDEEFELYAEGMNILPPEDGASFIFEKHYGSVFCCDLHPSFNLAVTGGEDDKAYVWDIETGEVTMTCNEFKDSVIFAAFSFDGTYLAAADMMGAIKVWECKEDEPWPLVFEYETGDITFGLWHFGARVLVFGTDSGQIYIFKIPSGETKVLQNDNLRVEYGKLFPDGSRLVVTYIDGTVKVWDIKSEKVIFNTKINQDNSVTDVAISHDNNLIAATGENGSIVLTLPNGKSAGELKAEGNLECLSFSNETNPGYLASGTLDGSLIIWDVAHKMPRNHCSSPLDGPGIIKLAWIEDQLIAGCLDGSVRIYDGKSGKIQRAFYGHFAEILDFTFSADRNIILTASDDGTARIYEI